MVRRVPHPLQVVMFFVMALNFAIWQPFAWWRACAAVLMLGFGCYGLFLWWKSKRDDSKGELSEFE